MKKNLRSGEKEEGVKTRNVINHNGSYYICLPKSFVTRHNISPGDKLALVPGEVLKVVPLGKVASA